MNKSILDTVVGDMIYWFDPKESKIYSGQILRYQEDERGEIVGCWVGGCHVPLNMIHKDENSARSAAIKLYEKNIAVLYMKLWKIKHDDVETIK